MEWQNHQVILFGSFSPPEMKEEFKNNTSQLTKRISLKSLCDCQYKSQTGSRYENKKILTFYAKLSRIKKQQQQKQPANKKSLSK